MNDTQVKNVEAILPSTMLAATLSVILVVVLTVVGELYAPLKNFLKDSMYHHWVGKGVWSVILFVLATSILYPIFKRRPVSAGLFIGLLNIALIVGSVILFVFFVYEYIAHH